MQCHTCQRSNDAEAIFCAYCGIRLDSAPIPAGGQPATGATVDLQRSRTSSPPPAPRRPTMIAPPPPTLLWAQQAGQRACGRQQQHRGNWAGFLLVGLGLLFLLKHLWWVLFIPAIFGLFAWSSYNHHTRHGHQRQAKRSLVWLLGIGVLIATGWWIPGIFIVWLIAAAID